MRTRTPLILAAAALLAVAGAIGAGLVHAPGARPFEPIAGCVAADGDTLQCGPERVRLMGIDAPEIAGHCRPETCPQGDWKASQDALAAGLARGPVTLQRWGTDRYGRTLAVVRGGADNLGCRQLRLGQAIYKPQWDQGDGVHGACPEVAPR